VSGASVYIDESWQIQVDYFDVPELIYQDSLVYKICDELDKCDSATLIITIDYESDDPVQVPNGFSPNGDGVNDYFVIPGIENYPGNELFVYNRWGSKVYSAKGYENSWDGKSNNNMAIGEPLAVGTYFYVLTLGNGINTITGYVYINH
jgi:gliding motility-associated-like protein